MKLVKTVIVASMLLSTSAFARDCAELTDLKSKLNSPVLLNVESSVAAMNEVIFDNKPAACAILTPLITTQKQVEKEAHAIEVGILKYNLAIVDTKTCNVDESIKDSFSYRQFSTLARAQEIFQNLKELSSQLNCR